MVSKYQLSIKFLILNYLNRFIQSSSPFTQALALGSLQCCGFSKSGPLPPLSPCLAEPKPQLYKTENGNVQDCVTLAAGITFHLTIAIVFYLLMKYSFFLFNSKV